jgi:hypothetical protein
MFFVAIDSTKFVTRYSYLLQLLHGSFFELARFADDAAEDADEGLGLEWAGILSAEAIEDLLFAAAIVDLQAARFFDGGQFARDFGALVEQAQQFAIEQVYLLASSVEVIAVFHGGSCA